MDVLHKLPGEPGKKPLACFAGKSLARRLFGLTARSNRVYLTIMPPLPARCSAMPGRIRWVVDSAVCSATGRDQRSGAAPVPKVLPAPLSPAPARRRHSRRRYRKNTALPGAMAKLQMHSAGNRAGSGSKPNGKVHGKFPVAAPAGVRVSNGPPLRYTHGASLTVGEIERGRFRA